MRGVVLRAQRGERGGMEERREKGGVTSTRSSVVGPLVGGLVGLFLAFAFGYPVVPVLYMLAAAQGVDLRAPHVTSARLQCVMREIRSRVKHYDIDHDLGVSGGPGDLVQRRTASSLVAGARVPESRALVQSDAT